MRLGAGLLEGDRLVLDLEQIVWPLEGEAALQRRYRLPECLVELAVRRLAGFLLNTVALASGGPESSMATDKAKVCALPLQNSMIAYPAGDGVPCAPQVALESTQGPPPGQILPPSLVWRICLMAKG